MFLFLSSMGVQKHWHVFSIPQGFSKFQLLHIANSLRAVPPVPLFFVYESTFKLANNFLSFTSHYLVCFFISLVICHT